MKRLLSYCLLAALACGGTGGPIDPLDDNGIIRILNRSSIAIVEVNISRCELAEWGANRLAGSIGPGQSRDFAAAQLLRCAGSRHNDRGSPLLRLALTRGNMLILEIGDG